MKKKLKLQTALMLLISVNCTFAQKELDNYYNKKIVSPYLKIDQDIFGGKFNQDRNYTMGVFLGVESVQSEKNYWGIPLLRKGIDYLAGIKKWQKKNINNIKFVSTMEFYLAGYTPLEIDNLLPVKNDRPFASIAGFSSIRTNIISEDDNEKYALTSQFCLAMLGTKAPGDVQSYIHENHWFGSTRPLPTGWPNQISNGGELTGLYTVQFMKPLRLHKIEFIDSLNEKFINTNYFTAQTNYFTELSLGYYTNAALGLNHRVGFFNQPWWSNQNYFSTTTGLGEDNGENIVNNFKKKHKWRYFFSTRAALRFIAYNELLQGGFRESDFTLKRNEIRRVMIEYALGLTVQYRNTTISFFPLIGRTSEHRLATKRNHIWGNITLSQTFITK